MAQVFEGSRGLQERLEDLSGVLGGQSIQQLGRDKLVRQRAALEIAEAAKQYEREDQAWNMKVQDRSREIMRQQAADQREAAFDNLRLLEAQRGIFSAEQSGRAKKQDAAAMAEVTPFDAIATAPNLPPQVAEGLKSAKGVYAKLQTDEARKLFTERTLPGISKAIDLHQRESFKAGIADRLSRASYGEDESVSEGLAQLQEAVDAGAPLPQVMQAETQLRKGLSESKSKMAKKQRLLAYAQTQAAALPPGPSADKAERAVMDFEAELIDEKGLQQALIEAQFGEEPQKAPLSPAELYLQVARVAKDSFAGADRDPAAIEELTEKLYARALELQQGGQEVSGGGRQRSPGSNQRGGLPFEQSAPSPNGANGQAPAAAPQQPMPQPAAAVEQAKALTGGEAKPADKASAIQQAEEAARNGASREEVEKLLREAGIDPAAPESSLTEKTPKKAKRAPRRSGRDDF